MSPLHGTRDWFPSEMRFRNYLFQEFRAVGVSHGFEEYDVCVLERQHLFKLKAGKAGEEIVDQMYAFTDKDGVEVALRPEVTPSLARMVLQRQNAAGEIKETLPLKWFCIAQCWRHETTQRGRKREHYQWNMDIVGHQGITAELELLSAVVDLFRRLKISSSDVSITINSRRVLNSVCTSYGVPADNFAAVCVVLDKLGKIGAATVKEELVSLNVPSISADKILQALSAKTVLGLLEQMMPVATDELLQACDEVTQLFALAEAYGFADFLQFDAGVVRGLAYYTGIVFECFDKNFGLRAICGGGRYDRLMSLYGSPVEVPCVGFGFGDCVIKELLEELKLMPSVEPSVDFVVGAYNQEMYAPSLKVSLLTFWLFFLLLSLSLAFCS